MQHTLHGVRPIILVWRVQRVVRRFLATQMERRRALAMALHPRLGSKSCVNYLPSDLLQTLIYDFPNAFREERVSA